MRFRLIGTLAAAVTIAAALVPPVASADPFPTQTLPLDPPALTSATMAEGHGAIQWVTLRCAYRSCDWRLSPRDGTAHGFEGDFNPFIAQHVELDFQQSARIVVRVDALLDGVHEGTETFSLLVEQSAVTGDGEELTRTDTIPMTILDADPLPVSPIARARVKHCRTCGVVNQPAPVAIPVPDPGPR